MTINICTASNEKYARYLYVMLESLYEHSDDDQLRIFILQRDISESTKEELYRLTNSYSQNIEFITVDTNLFSFLPTTDKFSLETYFRIGMSEYIPKNVDRILYLDVDIIIQHSLKELFELDLDDKAFGACQDYGLPVLDSFRKERFGRRTDNRYFNAGVMLWDMNLVRQKYPYRAFEKAAIHLGGELPYADQEIINYVAYDDVKYLDGLKYNYIADRYDKEEYRKYADDALIIHYAACNPWQLGAKNDLYKRWWNVAKDTPYYVELLEEQLARVENNDSSFVEKRNWEMAQIFKSFYELKGTGVLKEKLAKFTRYALYGAGYLSESFWSLIEAEGCEKPSFVIDKNKSGLRFHDIEILGNYYDVDWKDDMLIIVTPAGVSDQICESILQDLNHISVVSLKDFMASE